ncbi:MAG: hypothetical protein HYY93_15750 [Planctomycetes bacterium]|nr:hypothetical protein [Planctomycetota bacterium]
MIRSRWPVAVLVSVGALGLAACMHPWGGAGVCAAPPCSMMTRAGAPASAARGAPASAGAPSDYVQFWGYLGRRNTAGGRTSAAAAGSESEVEIVNAPPIPAGMTGRCTECHDGSQHSRSGRTCTGCAKAASLPGGCTACHRGS